MPAVVAEGRYRRRAVRRAICVGALCSCVIAAAMGPGAAAQDRPTLSVTVVPPKDAQVPPPTGNLHLSMNGRRLVTVPLLPELKPLTALTPLVAAAIGAFGQNVTISYSGDSNYEAIDGIVVTVPTHQVITIAVRRKDSEPPAIEIQSPGDGVRYEVGESVLAMYSCADPEARSTVRACDGPVADGSAIDTAVAGRHTFTVRAADALANASAKTVAFQVAARSSTPARSPTSAAAPPPVQPATPATPATPAVDAPVPAAAPDAPVEPVAHLSRASSISRRPAPEPKEDPPPPAAVAPADHLRPRRVAQTYAPYDPRSEPVKTMGILVAAFTLMQVAAAGGGGLGRSGARVSGSQSGSSGASDADGSAPQASFDYETLDVQHLGADLAAVATGDRSRTWSWPGTRSVDALGAAIPARVSRRSPLLARVLADGTYLRAIFGSASLFALLVGVALGVLALVDTGGEAIPPVATLTIAIALLGVFDATAGFVTVLIFTGGVLMLGGIDSNAHLRLMLGLGALWFVVPVLAGAVRPLRRSPAGNLEESWERAADFIIASLIGAWAVQKIILALPGLAGVELPLTRYANAAAYCVLAALVVRLALESLAANLYPRRLDVAEPGELDDPSAMQRLGATALRVAVFVFFANIVVGSSWQLWVGAALFVTPQILGVFEGRFPNSPGLFRALPKGLVELVLMLFVGTATGTLLISTMDENAETFIANSFVLLSLPGFLLSLLQLFARDGDTPDIGWGKRIAGVGLLVLGILLVLGLLL